MNISLLNKTGNSLSYLNGQVVVPASGNVSVDTGLVPYLALDPTFLNNLLSTPSSVLVSDGVNTFDGVTAQTYLATWLASGPPQNSQDPAAFTLAGFGYSVTADATFNNTNEVPLMYFSNPAGSGVKARAMFLYAAVDAAASQGGINLRVYSNPTVSANGAAATISNNLVGSSLTSAMNIFLGPTVTNNGTKRITITNGADSSPLIENFQQTAILMPGNSFLITGQAGNLGLLASIGGHFFIQWVEM